MVERVTSSPLNASKYIAMLSQETGLSENRTGQEVIYCASMLKCCKIVSLILIPMFVDKNLHKPAAQSGLVEKKVISRWARPRV